MTAIQALFYTLLLRRAVDAQQQPKHRLLHGSLAAGDEHSRAGRAARHEICDRTQLSATMRLANAVGVLGPVGVAHDCHESVGVLLCVCGVRAVLQALSARAGEQF